MKLLILFFLNFIQFECLNDYFIRLNKDTVKNYENCLNERNNLVKKGLNKYAIIYEQGEDALLECKLCELEFRHQAVIWKRKLTSNQGVTETIDAYQEDNKFSIDSNANLMVHDVRIYDEGKYWCEYPSGLRVYYYHLTVESFELKFPVYENVTDQNSILYHNQNVNFDALNLEVFTHWTKWSKCSSECSKLGYRKRIGHCYVKKIDIKQEKPNSVAFSLYKHGIPCKSNTFPWSLKEILRKMNLKSYIMFGDCLGSCNQVRTSNEYDETNGFDNEINSFMRDNSIGKHLKFVDSEVYVGTVGNSLRLKCFNKFHVQNPQIEWQKNGTTLDPRTLDMLYRKRISIDSINFDLHIKILKNEDQGKYSCYINKSLNAIIQLKLVPNLNIDFDFTQISIICGVLVTFTLLLFLMVYSFISQIPTIRKGASRVIF